MIKRVAATFTLDQLRAHLATEEQEVKEGFRTSKEWAEHFGVGRQKMRQLLNEAKAAGIVRVSGHRRETLDGRFFRVPVYAFEIDEDAA